MERITFATPNRRAIVTNVDGEYRIDLYAGDVTIRHRASGSRFTAIGIAQDWVGPRHTVTEAQA